MILIGAENLLELLTTIHFVAFGVEQIDVVGIGTVWVRQQYFVRVVGDVVESLLYPSVADLSGKTVISWCAGQVRVRREPSTVTDGTLLTLDGLPIGPACMGSQNCTGMNYSTRPAGAVLRWSGGRHKPP